MTSNTTPSPYVASASSEYGIDFAYGAFTVYDLHWNPSNSVEQWLQIYLGKSVNVQSFLLKARYDQAVWNAGWYLSASNDGVDYHVLYTGTVDQGATEQTYYSLHQISKHTAIIDSMVQQRR